MKKVRLSFCNNCPLGRNICPGRKRKPSEYKNGRTEGSCLALSLRVSMPIIRIKNTPGGTTKKTSETEVFFCFYILTIQLIHSSDIFFCFHRCFAATSGSNDSLAVVRVCTVTCCKNTWHIGTWAMASYFDVTFCISF